MQFNTDTEYVSISNHISRKVLAEHSKIRSLSNLSGSPDPANVRCCSESLSAPHGLPSVLRVSRFLRESKCLYRQVERKKVSEKRATQLLHTHRAEAPSQQTWRHEPVSSSTVCSAEYRRQPHWSGVVCGTLLPLLTSLRSFVFFLLWFDLIRCLFYLIFLPEAVH